MKRINITLQLLTFIFLCSLVCSCGSGGNDPMGAELGKVGPKPPDTTHCNNGKYDADAGETGIDCGGPCNVTCCNNGRLDKNLKETGIDCGGPCPANCCENGRHDPGEEKPDCGGKCPPCEGGEEVASCTDNIQNGDETGIDCGGSSCEACPSCYDGRQNQGEERVDCGGPCKACPSCYDGIRNQGETKIDCGGLFCAKCLEPIKPVERIVSAPVPPTRGGTMRPPTGPTEEQKKQATIAKISQEVIIIANILNDVERKKSEFVSAEKEVSNTISNAKMTMRESQSLKKSCLDHVAKELQDLLAAQKQAEKAKNNLSNAQEEFVDIKNTIAKAQTDANDFFNTAKIAISSSAASLDLNKIIKLVKKAKGELTNSNRLIDNTQNQIDRANRAVQKATTNYLEAKKNCPEASCNPTEYKSILSNGFTSISQNPRNKDYMNAVKAHFKSYTDENVIYDSTKGRYYSVDRFINRMNMEGSYQVNTKEVEMNEDCDIIGIKLSAVQLEE